MCKEFDIEIVLSTAALYTLPAYTHKAVVQGWFALSSESKKNASGSSGSLASNSALSVA